jgi:DNA-directed RNA polymerase specialized sigma24 family protein
MAEDISFHCPKCGEELKANHADAGKEVQCRQCKTVLHVPGATASIGGSITIWVKQLRAGDRAAIQKLWEQYYSRLVGLAQKKLRNLPRRAADEEDVVLSAINSFCDGVKQGRFPQLDDEDDLWQVLMLITARKASDLVEYESRDKRDWRKAQEQPDSSFPELLGREPDPAFAVEVAEECERLLDKLGNEELRKIAVWKMEGDTNKEIAPKLDCDVSTVERRLKLIRKHWEQEDRP